jgi:Protein of unknown function (DUF2442)
MREIKSIETKANYILTIEFGSGEKKEFDFKPYFNYPVFSILQDEKKFKEVENKNYFIEWKNYELDLSADTLWHVGTSK